MTWRQIVNLLRKRLPTDKPVKVRRVKKIPGSYHGMTYNHDTHYLIKIEIGCENCMLWALVHEYAHCLDNWHCPQDDHSDSFGVWWARCYRLVMEGE